MLGDLKNPKLIILKAALFLAAGVMAATLLFLGQPTLRTLFFLAIAIWAFCRAYYFAFYVITNYLDDDFKYSGILSALRHTLSARKK